MTRFSLPHYKINIRIQKPILSFYSTFCVSYYRANYENSGGPMFWAENEVGLPTLLAKLEDYWEVYPGSAYFKPSNMLRACVDRKLSVEEYCSTVLKKEQSTASTLSRL
jgi:hypothetical protein